MPSDPITEAGKRLVTVYPGVAWWDTWADPNDRIEGTPLVLAIEAEARAALLEELRGEVEALAIERSKRWGYWAVDRAAVYALLDDHKKGAAR